MKRVRRAHAKYVALGLTTTATTVEDEDGGGGREVPAIQAPVPMAFPGGMGTADEDLGLGAVIEDVKVDERMWGGGVVGGAGACRLGGASRIRMGGGGRELGGKNAESCLGWVNGKVLEHSGFQGPFVSLD